MSDKFSRLSDHILSAIQIAIEQKDVEIAESLIKSLELSLTRNAGGGEFVERRNYPEQLKNVTSELEKIKAEQAN